MALEVEDGTAKSNADSYISLVDARAFATDRGLALPSNDVDAEAALRRAAEYIDSFGEFSGSKYTAAQSLQWPRIYAYVNGFEVGYDDMPSALGQAQVYAAVLFGDGTDLLPSGTSAPVRRERVGPLETEYDTSGGRGSIVPRATAVEAILRPLLKSTWGVSRA